MRNATCWNTLALYAVLVAAGACGGSGSEEDETDRGHGIIGSWFRCEFVDGTKPAESPTDDCKILDDDGLRFATNGTLFSIEATNSPENVCNKGVRGKCFPRDTTDIQIAEKQKGTYEVEEGDLVRMLYSSGNEATFELRGATKGYHLFDNYIVKKPTGDEPKPKFRYMYRYR